MKTKTLANKIVDEMQTEGLNPDEMLKVIKLTKSLVKKTKLCNSQDPDDMCSNCNCWKSTRLTCS